MAGKTSFPIHIRPFYQGGKTLENSWCSEITYTEISLVGQGIGSFIVQLERRFVNEYIGRLVGRLTYLESPESTGGEMKSIEEVEAEIERVLKENEQVYNDMPY